MWKVMPPSMERCLFCFVLYSMSLLDQKHLWGWHYGQSLNGAIVWFSMSCNCMACYVQGGFLVWWYFQVSPSVMYWKLDQSVGWH